MSKQKGPVYYTGTVGGICYYQMNGQYYARRKSNLSRKRVKRDPVFAPTRKYAELLGQASRIAAGVYRLLPRGKKKLALYRAMTGQAVVLLKRGMQEAEVREQLERETKKGLKGVQKPLKVSSLKQRVQLCIVHQIRNSQKYLSYKDVKPFMKDLQGVFNMFFRNNNKPCFGHLDIVTVCLASMNHYKISVHIYLFNIRHRTGRLQIHCPFPAPVQPQEFIRFN